MRNGTEYAKRVKRLFKQLQPTVKDAETGEPTDPTEQLIFAMLAVSSTPEQAGRAQRRLRERMVDYNELRVSSPAEISAMIRDLVPGSLDRSRALIDTLNAVYQSEHEVDLSRLRSMGIRDAKRYLEELDGVEAYAVASVLLWSLGGHAVPVSDRMLEVLREEEMIDPESDAGEVQSFLERHISASDAKLFCMAMDEYVASKKGGRKSPRSSAKKGRGQSARSAGKSSGGGRKKKTAEHG